jgi:hypothetical protein
MSASAQPPLVLYNPLKGGATEVPQLPTAWVTIHASATSASLFAGAVTYAMTNMAGSLTTAALSKGLSLSGTLLAEGARLIGGPTAANNVKHKLESAASKTATAGVSVTNSASLMSAATAAAVAGGTVMIGNVVGSVLYSAYKNVREGFYARTGEDEIIQTTHKDEDDGYEFIICDVRPLDVATTETEPPPTSSIDSAVKAGILPAPPENI